MKAKRLYSYEPDYAVPPGETLQEVMQSLDMTQRDLAARAELTVQSLIRIFKGEQPISYETANKLELVTNVPARFWNNLESNYREQLARSAEREQMEQDLEWLKMIPVRELINRGEVEEQKDKVLQLREVLSFYGTSSVDAWHDIWDEPVVAARRSQCFESRLGSASAWIRLGERSAHKAECNSYDEKRFREALVKIRSLTRKDVKVFEPAMRELCAEAGVALSFVPEMKKVPWNGASKWLSPKKAMILLNLRGKGEDRFWFSFFHEAGHVLHDSKKDLLINDGSENDPREKKANAFASEFLIPDSMNSAISTARSATALRTIAKELDVAPGIVAGRYQFLTKKWNYYKDLIRTFNWAE
jgi:HTH-type transcriptional regulator / antitoxin HigA